MLPENRVFKIIIQLLTVSAIITSILSNHTIPLIASGFLLTYLWFNSRIEPALTPDDLSDTVAELKTGYETLEKQVGRNKDSIGELQFSDSQERF